MPGYRGWRGHWVGLCAAHCRRRLHGFAAETEHTTAYPGDIAELHGDRKALQRMMAEQGLPKAVVNNPALATFAP
ncbi:MAG: hypothetical protein O2967_01045 [Proteobacteria bacterium]|nr:hypothetical protein [Pseudomonadota bacterium]